MKKMFKTLFGLAVTIICFFSVVSVNAQEKMYRKGISPYLTGRTVLIKRKVPFEQLFPVSDGVIGLVEFNMKTYTENWEFYTIEGKHIFPSMWAQYDKYRPRFDSGACIVKNPENNTTTIIYLDGRVKELPSTYVTVTEFVDGVAMVQEYSNNKRNFFYIDVMGEKIYPHLSEPLEGYRSHVEIRPLKCGMRAFYSNNAKKWGFIDEYGNVVIKPQFEAVRDFANDYAMVIVKDADSDGRLVVIDKSGKTICQASEQSISTMYYARNITDVSENGIFAVSNGHGEDTHYYSVAPFKELYNINSGMNFVNGYAFMLADDSDTPIVVNEKFRKVGIWNFTYSDFAYKKPEFSPYGLVTIDEKIVLDAEANHIIEMPETGGYYIGNFSDDGYAPFSKTFTMKKDNQTAEVEVTGYCRDNGQIVLAFCEDVVYGELFIINDPLPGPEPEPWEPEPWKPEPVPAPLPPIGPTTKEAAKYEVKVVAVPGKAATVYGTGYYEFGDTVRVTGKIAEGWTLGSIECDRLVGATTKDFNKFVVRGEMTITCNFVEDIEPETPPTSTYRSKMEIPQFDGSVVEVPIWLEMSNDKDVKSPYGDNTYGYLAVAYNPDSVMHFGDEDSETILNAFMAPMLVKGVSTDKETGKNYLMLDGGEYAIGNMFVKDKRSDSGGINGLNSLMVNLMLLFDRYKTVKITPARYRVEILNGNIGDDTFEFGKLERLAPGKGWLPGGDKAFLQRSKGLFVTSQSAGLEQNFLAGRVMKRSADKPQIWWYPTDAFYGGEGDTEMMEKSVEELGKNYHEYVSDIDYLKNLNFSDFVINLENNLLKRKK